MSPALDYSLIAEYYDAVVRTDEDLPFWVEECGGARGKVLELMAGTGRVSLPLLEAGVDLTCVDSSPEMLAVLRQKLERRGLSAEIYVQDIQQLDLPTAYEVILVPFQSFQELVVREDRQRALEAIYLTLARSGRFICTLHNPSVRLRSVGGESIVLGPFALDQGKISLEVDLRYRAGSGRVEGTETLVHRDRWGREIVRRSIPLEFALIDDIAFREETQACGFQVDELYGDYDRSPYDRQESPFMIYFLRREDARS